MNKLVDFLIKNVENINQEDIDYHIKNFEKVSFPKKTVLTQKGQTENYLYFAEEGILRFYSELPSGKETTIGFVFPNIFFCSYMSFILREPSFYSLECLTPVVLYRVTYEGLQDIYKNTKHGQYIGRMCAEQLFIAKSRREFSLLAQTPKERYMNILEHFPDFIRTIPLKHIASYIGITPQALSRIRAGIS